MGGEEEVHRAEAEARVWVSSLHLTASCIITSRWLHPHSRLQATWQNSEHSTDAARRLHYRVWSLEGSSKATAEAQHKVPRLGAELRECSRGQRSAWQGSGTAVRESVYLTFRDSDGFSEVLPQDKKQTRHLVMIIVTCFECVLYARHCVN